MNGQVNKDLLFDKFSSALSSAAFLCHKTTEPIQNENPKKTKK
jgi:hypothetical protein